MKPVGEEHAKSSLIRLLPEELLVAIIRKSVVTVSSSTIPYIDINLLLPLMLVSSIWKSVIEATATLWTDIVIDNQEDLALKTALCLCLSREAPLSLYFSASIKFGDRSLLCWDLVKESIIGQRSRIRTISIPLFGTILRVSPGLLWMERFQQALYQLAPLPYLETLDYFASDTTNLQEFIEQHSSLIDISGPMVHLQMLGNDSRPWFRLTTAVSVLDTVPLLEHTKSLKHVDFFFSPSPRSGTQGGQVKSRLGDTTTLEWVSLQFRQSYDIHFNHMLYKLSSSLKNLVLGTQIRPENLKTILPIISNCGRLKTLTLQIAASKNDIFPPIPPSPRPMNHLENLILIFYLKNKTFLGALGSHFRELAPSILSLSLRQRPFEHSIHFIESASFSKIKTMVLRPETKLYNSEVSMQRMCLFSPSLQELRISCGPKRISQILAPSLLVLSVQPDWMRGDGFASYDLGGFPHIHSLQLNRIALLWDGSHLLHLKEVVINNQSERGKDSITQFCQQLAIHPDHLPALQHLGLDQFPEWDIFFLMLEARSSVSSRRISRLRRIELPSHCPRSLRECVVKLLKGEAVHRPSNYDLSFVGNRDILYDSSIPGCVRCHKALRICSKEVGKCWMIYPGQNPNARDLCYPDMPDEILATWPERHNAWNSGLEIGRDISCGLERELPTIITEDSLEDPTFEHGSESF